MSSSILFFAVVIFCLQIIQTATHFSDEAKSNPKHGDAYISQGVALSNLGKDEEAIESYDQAIKINPKDATAHNSKGFVLNNLYQF